jgi:amino-acid N-acetyltransferase
MQRDTSSFVLRRAAPADESTLRALLQSAKLPFDDVATSRQDFIVATSDGQLGCAALETFGDAALLRSLVVTEKVRGAGLGGLLYERLVGRAREKGLRRLFLLTTTAAPFFAKREDSSSSSAPARPRPWRAARSSRACARRPRRAWPYRYERAARRGARGR